MGKPQSKQQSQKSTGCIRNSDESQAKKCHGHVCCACDGLFYCGVKHECKPRPRFTETGIARRETLMERLATGMTMLAMAEDEIDDEWS